jgi:virulence-associated protein VagC
LYAEADALATTRWEQMARTVWPGSLCYFRLVIHIDMYHHDERGHVDRNRGSGEKRAKVFWTGRSQAVRLPKEFRFDEEEVAVYRDGDRVILEPLRRRRSWPRGYWERLDELARGFEFPEVTPLPPGANRPDLGEW